MRGQFTKGVVVGALVAAVVTMAGTAFAGSGVGAVFNLGKGNSVNKTTALSGKTSGKLLGVTNKGAGPALGLSVKAGKAPLTVNSTGLVKKLNADTVDGMHATDIAAAHIVGGRVAYPVLEAVQVCTLPGFGAIEATPDGNGSLVLHCTATIEDGKVTVPAGSTRTLASDMNSKTDGSSSATIHFLWNGTTTATLWVQSGGNSSNTAVNTVQAVVQ